MLACKVWVRHGYIYNTDISTGLTGDGDIKVDVAKEMVCITFQERLGLYGYIRVIWMQFWCLCEIYMFL